MKCFTEIEIFFLLLSDSWPKSQRERERVKREVKQPPLLSLSISMFSDFTVLFFSLLSNSVKMVKEFFTRSFGLVAVNL